MKKNKLTIMIIVVILALILCVLAFRLFSGNKNNDADLPDETPAAAAEPVGDNTVAEEANEENASEITAETTEETDEISDDAQESQEPRILESEGAIEIIYSEDEDTFGE